MGPRQARLEVRPQPCSTTNRLASEYVSNIAIFTRNYDLAEGEPIPKYTYYLWRVHRA